VFVLVVLCLVTFLSSSRFLSSRFLYSSGGTLLRGRLVSLFDFIQTRVGKNSGIVGSSPLSDESLLLVVCSLLLQELVLSGSTSSFVKKLVSASTQSLRVQFDHEAKVLERIPLARSSALELSGTDTALDFVRVDDTVKVGIGHHGSGKGEVLL